MGYPDGAALPKHMLIGGKLVGAELTYPSVNPATGEILGYAPDASEADARAAVAAARRAFDTTSWSTDVAFRTRCLEQLHAALSKHKEELRELTIADVGAPRQITYGAQLDEPIEIVQLLRQAAAGLRVHRGDRDREFMGAQHRRWVEYEAVGVVAAIIGYNYPTQLALAKLAPALAAGCTVVLKAAPQTPLITLALAEHHRERDRDPAGRRQHHLLLAGLGRRGAHHVAGRGRDDLHRLHAPPGARIMAAAAATIKRVFLELGGKSALVVLDDADLHGPAMVAAFAACSHAGPGLRHPHPHRGPEGQAR